MPCQFVKAKYATERSNNHQNLHRGFSSKNYFKTVFYCLFCFVTSMDATVTYTEFFSRGSRIGVGSVDKYHTTVF